MSEAQQPYFPLAFSISEACRVSSLGRTRIYALIKEGRIRVTKVGGRTLVVADSLRALVEGGSSNG